MGVKEKFKQYFLGPKPKKETEFLEETLGQHAIKVASDHKLDNRIAILMQFEDYICSDLELKKTDDGKVDLDDYCKQLKERLDKMDHVIKQVAWPFFRGGTDIRFARAIRGWSQWYATASGWILQAQRLLQAANRKEEGESTVDTETGDIETLIYFMHSNLTKHCFKCGNYILGVCFRNEDVSPQSVTVIQSVMPMMGGGGETITGSGGRTSEDGQMRRPQGGPYPRKMKNEVD
jgi:hypothetical protein